ncbi:hypothetical protein H4R21_000434 [Coemansia helicoidea]|uniref:Uncharacterized protein n=1 Tax=Coemansia helicoidea TaxID=1286919 RepID=A0ACC1LGD2_9FUNG|nr:hypothetical protein H4R21_000434 [Coemansia helicoidea]
MGGGKHADYFALVDAQGDAPPSCAEIEAGLEAALTRAPDLAAGAPRYIRILLDRFVYTGRDRVTPQATATALAILKLLGRGAADGGEMATGPALDGLLHLVRTPLETPAGGPVEADIRNEALTCVANAMCLQPACRAHVAQRRCLEALATALDAAGDDPTTAFLAARCLLFALATEEGAQCGYEELGLQDTIARMAEIHLGCAAKGECPGRRFTPQQVLAELLKAGMGMCGFVLRRGHPGSDAQDSVDDSFPPEMAPRFARLLQVALDVVRTLPLADGHLAAPAVQAVHIAMNFSTVRPAEIEQLWFPRDDPWRYVDPLFSCLAGVLDHAVGSDEAASLADTIDRYQFEFPPLAMAVARLVTDHARVRERLFLQVYPDNTVDYTVLPEERGGLSAKLVRLMRIPQGGLLPTAAGDLLLALLGHDIKGFVMAVGYGNAAGYMVARGIPIPQDIVDQVRSSVGASAMVDPVTGRRLDRADVERELAAMTDEEKEREAERLFVLFERLNKTGVVKVANPVRVAAESGRLEEPDGSSK